MLGLWFEGEFFETTMRSSQERATILYNHSHKQSFNSVGISCGHTGKEYQTKPRETLRKTNCEN